MASEKFNSVSNENLLKMFEVASKSQKMALDADMPDMAYEALLTLAEIGQEIQHRGMNYPIIKF